jgi:hypothetical protein
MMATNDFIRIDIADRLRWSTLAVFNANAYPDDLHSIVTSCQLRLALLVANANALRREVSAALDYFQQELSTEDMVTMSNSARKVRLVAFAYSDGYIGSLYSLLAVTRSFLDIYALLMSKLIDRRLTWSFGSKAVDGEPKAGGRMINWLRHSAPSNLDSAAGLTVC